MTIIFSPIVFRFSQYTAVHVYKWRFHGKRLYHKSLHLCISFLSIYRSIYLSTNLSIHYKT